MEKKYIALQIACGDISDIELQGKNIVIKTFEQDIFDTLQDEKNKKIIYEALKWQGSELNFVVERKIKLSEYQEQDLKKLKTFCDNIVIEEGE